MYKLMHFYLSKMAVAIGFLFENAVDLFSQINGRTPRGPRAVKNQIFFTNETVEFLPLWHTKHFSYFQFMFFCAMMGSFCETELEKFGLVWADFSSRISCTFYHCFELHLIQINKSGKQKLLTAGLLYNDFMQATTRKK